MIRKEKSENRKPKSGKQEERRDAVIAAAVTFAAAIAILLILFLTSLNYDRRALAETSMPELQDDEEIYLEPELLAVGHDGETELNSPEEAAPQPPGVPDQAEKEQPERVVPNAIPPKEQPVSNKPKLTSTTEESDLKTSTPKLSKEEEKRMAALQGMKTDNNGSHTGKESETSSTGGNGVSAAGTLKGRSMLSCPTWKVKANKTTVKVKVTVDADGNVTAASFESGTATPNLRTQCEKMARGSKWTPKKGAAPATGTITFTIIPK